MTRHDTETESNLTRPASRTEKTTEPETTVTLEGALEGIRRTTTIADRVEFESVRRELPTDWEVLPDLVQFGSEPLAETIRFRRTRAGPQLILKPTDPADPAGEIECYERGGPRTARRLTMTVVSLEEALRVAVNRVRQLN